MQRTASARSCPFWTPAMPALRHGLALGSVGVTALKGKYETKNPKRNEINKCAHCSHSCGRVVVLKPPNSKGVPGWAQSSRRCSCGRVCVRGSGSGWFVQDALQVFWKREDYRVDVGLKFGQRPCSYRQLLSLCLRLENMGNNMEHVTPSDGS